VVSEADLDFARKLPPDLRSLLVRPSLITFTSNLVGPKVISLWARSTSITFFPDLVGAKVKSTLDRPDLSHLPSMKWMYLAEERACNGLNAFKVHRVMLRVLCERGRNTSLGRGWVLRAEVTQISGRSRRKWVGAIEGNGRSGKALWAVSPRHRASLGKSRCLTARHVSYDQRSTRTTTSQDLLREFFRPGERSS
jgi:hypothetical protein